MSHWEATGKSDHWYTPPYIFEALNCPFDMDVAAPMLIPAYIRARRWLWKESLETEWSGFIWMNPPFGGRNSLEPWLRKFFDHGDGIALTPDRTSAPWFRESWPRADLVLFMPKVKFLRPNGTLGKSPSNGTALWAVGTRGTLALERAAEKGLGILAVPRASDTQPKAGDLLGSAREWRGREAMRPNASGITSPDILAERME